MARHEGLLRLLDLADEVATLRQENEKLKTPSTSHTDFLYKELFPVPRDLTTPTSKLACHKSKTVRRADTEKLLSKSLSAINGGEVVFPLSDYFTKHPDLLDEVLSEVGHGKWKEENRDSILSEVTASADLMAFVQLLDESPCLNVSGLRTVHKILVAIFTISYLFFLFCSYHQIIFTFHISPLSHPRTVGLLWQENW